MTHCCSCCFLLDCIEEGFEDVRSQKFFKLEQKWKKSFGQYLDIEGNK